MTEADLIKRGWKKLDVTHVWCWQEPKTHAKYTFQDAVDLEKSKHEKR